MATKTLTIDIDGDARGLKVAVSQADSDLSRLGSSVSHTDSKFGSLVGTLGSAAKGLGIALGGAAIGFGLVSGAGVKIAADMEQAKVSFTTMLGSAEKADAFISEMKAFAAKTPFEFAGLQQASSALISIGIDTSKVIPIMTTLGNVTSGMGTGEEGIKRATVALQQMNAAGKITAEDLNQLRDAGVPVFDLLSAATGKTKTQIAEMAANGKLGRQELEQLMSALETGKGLERFNGLMEAQSQTLTGMLSTLKDTVTMGLADPMGPLVSSLKDSLPQITAVAGQLTGALGPFIGQLVTSLSPLLQALAPVVTTLATQLGGVLGSALGAITPLIQALAPHVQKLLEVAGPALTGLFEKLGPPIGKILGALGPILPMLADLAGTVLLALADAVAPVVEALAPFITQLIEQLKPVFEEIKPTLIELGKQLGPIMVDSLNQIMPLLLDLTGALLPIIPPIVTIIAKVIEFSAVLTNSGMHALKDLVNWLREKVPQALEWLGDKFAWFRDHVLDPIAGVAQTVADKVSGAFSFAADVVRGALNALIGAWNWVAANVKINLAVPDWVPLVGGKRFDFQLPQIQKLHEGTSSFNPGMGRSEGLALLRRGERVTTPTSGAGASVNITGGTFIGSDERSLGKFFVQCIEEYQRNGGRAFA